MRLEAGVLEVLKERDGQQCEQKLLDILQSDKSDNLSVEVVDLVKRLTNNRFKIYFCTMLNKTQNAAEKEQYREAMSKDERGREVLAELENQGKKHHQRMNAQLQKLKKETKNFHQEDLIQEEEDLLLIGNQGTNVNDEEFSKITKRIVDLDKLAFQKGNHFMSNDKVKFHEDAQRLSKQGYEEIYVPAAKPAPKNSAPVKVDSLPPWSQKAFMGIKELNQIQSTVFNTAFKSDENMLICAPTGAGKTVVALLTML